MNRFIVKNLIPISCETVRSNDVKHNNKNVGKIIEFVETYDGIDAVIEITDKSMLKKLKKEK